jgi:predicted amidohydrolase
MENSNHIDEIRSIGVDGNKGNILGIQPFMNPSDYASEENFTAALDSYLSTAKINGLLNKNTIVVFPEYIGTWLLFAGEKFGFIKSNKIDDLVNQLITLYPKDFSKYLAISKERDNVLAAIFRLKSEVIAKMYQNSFSQMAKNYSISIVAGSVILSNPSVNGGKLIIQNGPLYNISAVFNQDGNIYPYLVKKIYPVPAEIGFVTPGSLADLKVIEVPTGKLGVLVCGDSWYKDPYKKMRDEGADFIVVPSYLNENNIWGKPWKGYPEYATEAYDKSDIGKITEGKAWGKYALEGKIHLTKATKGVNVFLKGNLWDMGADSGYSMAIAESKLIEISNSTVGFVNVWLS